MTPEQLMKPRYIVIADWPGNNCFQPNEIFYEDDARVNNNPHWVNLSFKEMPHLFRKLSWWEHREEKDMPEYVKRDSGKIFKIERPRKALVDEHAIVYMAERDERGVKNFIYLRSCLPATETEYNNYKNIK